MLTENERLARKQARTEAMDCLYRANLSGIVDPSTPIQRITK